MDAWQVAQGEQEIYVAALPQWVQLWMNWMTVVLGLGGLIAAIFTSSLNFSPNPLYSSS